MTLFPFNAIVEQKLLKRALMLNAVNPAVGGVLVKGQSGTAKSTAVRGLAELMPEIAVTRDCPFSCDPDAPCTRCAELADSGEAPVAITRKQRVVDLPLNATEDRIAGTLDLSRALREGVKALEPGLLAQANRGILYIDEINLLDDHLVDLLLDAAALGVNTVEREGISVSHPARFLLVGTMNEEEGELRPQIADRLALTVAVEPLNDADARAEVMRRRERFARDPAAFADEHNDAQAALSTVLPRASQLVGDVQAPEEHYRAIAQLVLRTGVGSHRADIAVLECAKAMAALGGRTETTVDDVAEAAALVLPHRVSGDPFEPALTLDAAEIRRIVDDVLERRPAQKKRARRLSRRHVRGRARRTTACRSAPGARRACVRAAEPANLPRTSSKWSTQQIAG